MLDFQVPRISSDSVDDNRGSFTIEPLDRGFGYTFGNSLRRVLLSSLSGAAVTSVRIEGVAHEFSTIRGVKEDVTDIVLNLKGVVCRMHSDATEIEAPLVVTGPGDITAKDIDLPSGVEILNPDAHIATLEKKTKLEVYLTIGRGRGYRPAEENKSADQPIGVIPIDSIFSPVRRVTYDVDQARVGQKTDFDKLTLDIETDGSVDPQAALREAAELLISQLAIFTDPDRNKLSRDSAHRKALLMNLSKEIIEHERVKTSAAKAKAVKPEIEKLITLAKRGDLHARRQALSTLSQDKFAVHKLFEEVAPRYAGRNGGYTRILKLGPRRSDATEMVFIELV